MTAYDLLSEPIRRYVKDQKWDAFTPIQTAAIVKIMTTDNNYILASKTASGKTEAAFLPILSTVDFNQFGVQVLYISPLIALINDQMERVENLCKYLDVNVTKWHGEANATLKKKLVESPNGIVLITPESLEAMFQNKPQNVKRMFSSLKFVVIDEIHYYFGTDRGVHLRSLLHRLSGINENRFRFIGLSATIGDYVQAKQFLGEEKETLVLLDKTPKEHEVSIKYYSTRENVSKMIGLDLLKDLYKSTCQGKALVFANSRDKVEEISVKLLKISEIVGGHSNYFTHHSSVDQRLREYAAYFAKHSYSEPFTIFSTSTLELGIDIGNVDLVAQVEAPYEVSSMVQRMGRSGRTQNSISKLLMYSINKWDLLRSLACWKLYEEGKMEAPKKTDKPYDILLHQTMSIVKERLEIAPSDLIREMHENVAFSNCNTEIMKKIIRGLIYNNMLEMIGGKLIIGLAADRYFAMGNFYSVFWDKKEYEVQYYGDVIGSWSPSFELFVGRQIYLAGGVWVIVDIDDERMKIKVKEAPDGDTPYYGGNSLMVSYMVEKEMLNILYDTEDYPVLDEAGLKVLHDMRNEFSHYERIGSLGIPINIKGNTVSISPFFGSITNSTIFTLFRAHCYTTYNEINRRISVSCGFDKFKNLLQKLSADEDDNEKLLIDEIQKLEDDEINNISKFACFLPRELQVRLAYDKMFDLPSAMKEIKGMLD